MVEKCIREMVCIYITAGKLVGSTWKPLGGKEKYADLVCRLLLVKNIAGGFNGDF